jgi:hypothetical protein
LLLVKSDAKDRSVEAASIEIPFKVSQTGCQVKLWYWMSNSYFGSLKISTRSSIGQLWTDIIALTSSTSTWTKIETDIPEGVDFQLIITGELDELERGYLAIDDVSFTETCLVDLDLLLPTSYFNSTNENENSSTPKIDGGKKDSSLG